MFHIIMNRLDKIIKVTALPGGFFNFPSYFIKTYEGINKKKQKHHNSEIYSNI